MIQWKKEFKILLKRIKQRGFVFGIKYHISELNDLRILGYFKY